MSVSQKLLAKLKETVDTTKEQPIICQEVLHFKPKNKSSKRILLVTQFRFYLFKKLKSSKKSKSAVVAKYSWLKATKIVLYEDDKIQFIFKNDKIDISDADYDLIFQLVRMHLCSFLKPKELPIFEVPQNYELPSVSASLPAVRFVVFILDKGTKISHQYLDKITNYFDMSPSVFKFSDFSSVGENFAILLDCIPLQYSIHTINVDIPLDTKLIQILSAFVPQNKSVTEILITAPIKSSLTPLIRAISLDKIPIITAFSVVGSSMSDSQVIEITNIVKTHKLESLTLERSLKKINIGTFLKNIENSKYLSSIREINLRYSELINPHLLMPLLTNIRILNLAECHVEITMVIQLLGSCGLNQIEALDLSRNQGSIPFSNSVNIPLSLRALKLDNVVWKTNILSDVFQIIVLHKPTNGLLDFSMKNTGLSFDQWDMQFNELLLMENAHFGKFVWDGNYIDDRLFTYLQQCPEIYSISLFDCVNKFSGVVKMISHIIIDSNSLKTVKMNTSEPFQYDISPIVTALTKSKTLTCLNIQGAILTEENLVNLSNALLKNNRLSELEYDFLGLTDFESFNYFFSNLQNRGAPLKLNFPTAAVEHFRAEKVMSDNELINLRNMHQKILSGIPKENFFIDIPEFNIEHISAFRSKRPISPPKNIFDLDNYNKPRKASMLCDKISHSSSDDENRFSNIFNDNIFIDRNYNESNNNLFNDNDVNYEDSRNNGKPSFSKPSLFNLNDNVDEENMPGLMVNLPNNPTRNRRTSSFDLDAKIKEFDNYQQVFTEVELQSQLTQLKQQLDDDTEWPIYVPQILPVDDARTIRALWQRYSIHNLLSEIRKC